MKNHPQSLAMRGHAVPVHGAPYGALNGYMAIEPEKLHARQSSVLFKVNVPQSMAKGQPQAPSVLGLAWADARTPVVVFGFCLGKVYIAAAINPLDPATRARLREATASGKFTAVVEFNSTDPNKAEGNFDTALIGIPAETFKEVLERNEGLKAGCPKAWGDVAVATMLGWLGANGIDNGVLNRVKLSAFSVVPVEADGELCAGWA